MLTARQRFLEVALQKKGAVVVWGGLDCSELVALALRGAGGKDFTKSHRAQTFADETPNLATMNGARGLPGDLVVCGYDPANISHIGILLAGGRVLSADGATSKVTDPKVAELNKKARVREHDFKSFRLDLPYRAVHRNRYVDDLDMVTM